jgi:hypothetical protein
VTDPPLIVAVNVALVGFGEEKESGYEPSKYPIPLFTKAIVVTVPPDITAAKVAVSTVFNVAVNDNTLPNIVGLITSVIPDKFGYRSMERPGIVIVPMPTEIVAVTGAL